MCITVDMPWAVGGEHYPATDLWADMPDEPQNGDPVSWDHGHVWWKGQQFSKPEDDSNPAVALH